MEGRAKGEGGRSTAKMVSNLHERKSEQILAAPEQWVGRPLIIAGKANAPTLSTGLASTRTASPVDRTNSPRAGF